MKKILLYAFTLLLITLPAYASSPKQGEKAPDFSVVSMDGGEVSLSSLKGKVVLMGMFHICVPCMNQAMEFQKVRNQIPSDNLVVMGINTNGDTKKNVKEYLSQFPKKIDFPYYLDPPMSVHKAYIQRDMPTVLIIDKDGIIRARGPSVGAGQLVPYLKKML